MHNTPDDPPSRRPLRPTAATNSHTYGNTTWSSPKRFLLKMSRLREQVYCNYHHNRIYSSLLLPLLQQQTPRGVFNTQPSLYPTSIPSIAAYPTLSSVQFFTIIPITLLVTEHPSARFGGLFIDHTAFVCSCNPSKRNEQKRKIKDAAFEACRAQWGAAPGGCAP